MDPGRHMVFLRDSVAKVLAARQIIAIFPVSEPRWKWISSCSP